MAKKKPNYKLRRNLAKTFLVLIIIIPIVLINRVKLAHLPLYLSNTKYTDIIDAMFEIKYTGSEAKSTLNYLKEKKKINDNTDDYILKLNTKGYSKNTIDYLIRNLNKSQITDFLDKKYNKDFEEYIKLDLFKYSKYNRYTKYQSKHKDLSLEDVVIRVELNMDKTYYEDSEFIKNPDEITTLSNKYFEIPEDYEPKDLVELDSEYVAPTCDHPQLRKVAAEALVKMIKDAKKEGMYLLLNSGYRSYEEQEKIYQETEQKYGGAYAAEYVATPGASEHQTGLGIDMTSQSVVDKQRLVFGDTTEYKWVVENCAKYGFIVRFTEGTDGITGISHEPWHLRYVGKKVAKEIKDQNWTLEEYCLYKNVIPKFKKD